MLNCSLKLYKKNYYNTLQRFQKKKGRTQNAQQIKTGNNAHRNYM